MRPLRFLLAITLAITVPFQGALAVSTAQCQALEQQQDDGSGHHEDAHAGHVHDQHQHQHPDSKDGKHPSSHCAPCSASAAIASAIQVFDVSAVNDALTSSPELSPPGFLPGGLDRPPRTTL